MIDYSTTPQNNLFAASTPQFQDWGPYVPGGLSDYDIVIDYAPNSGQPIPTPTVNYKILDVIGNPLFAEYTEFRLRTVGNHLGTSGVNWLVPDSASPAQIGYQASLTIPITQNGINYNFSPQLRLLDSLEFDNTYVFGIQRIMQGKNAQGNWQSISFYTSRVVLNYSSFKVAVTPGRLDFSYIRTFPEAQNITVYGDFWKVVGQERFVMSIVSGTAEIVDEYYDEEAPELGSRQVLYGEGVVVIGVTPGVYFESNDLSEAIVYGLDVWQKDLVGDLYTVFVRQVILQVVIFEDEILISEPRELIFEGAKGFAEPLPQYIFYKCTNPVYAVSSSPWVITDLVVLNIDGVNRRAIEVKMIPNSNLNVGTYEGLVQISAVIKGGTETQVTKIFYRLTDFVDAPYAGGKRAFTLDKEFVKFSTINTNTYMQFDIVAKVYDFFTNVEHLFTIPQKIALFKGKAELNVGRTIHRIMKRFSGVNANEFQYKIAQVYFDCTEKNYTDNAIVRQVQSEVISFVAGLSHPNKDMTILDINLKPNRVNTNSYIYLNILLKFPASDLEVLRNGVLHETIALPFTTDTLITKKMFFSDFEKGDVISYRVVNGAQNRGTTPEPTDTSMLKLYKIFDEGDFSNQIIWENEYLLQSTVDCTGSYKIQSDIEFQSQMLLQQLVEVLEVLDSTKSVKLTINTGWLLKTDVDTIESLMRSQRIWLEQGETSIDLRPAGKSIVNEDSERERIEFTLEFTINKKYNEETYSL